MPAIDEKIINDLNKRLIKYLESTGGYESISYIDAGGSAAIFKVQRSDGLRAIKIFNPELFFGIHAEASKRRLKVQQQLINHTCPSLIQTYSACESQDTAIIEMEFNEWPQLSKRISEVPDAAIGGLMNQLIESVKYLEKMNIIHRDIKPENIHVSDDFQNLKLLDLGVAREFDNSASHEAEITDSGVERPFLATAQYSSPEYLFRLDEPTEKLWKGLNFYQIGAVLHDLIKKEALFQNEINLNNRWLVARAVLTKQPSFSDSDTKRLPTEKVLALRCLTKDLDTRLSLVDWNDFQFNKVEDSLTALTMKLSKGIEHLGKPSESNATAQLLYERQKYCAQLFEKVRDTLTPELGTKLPVVMSPQYEGNPARVVFIIKPTKIIKIRIDCRVSWKSGIYEKYALIDIGAIFTSNQSVESPPESSMKACFEICIEASEDGVVKVMTDKVAELITLAISRIEASSGDVSALQGTSV